MQGSTISFTIGDGGTAVGNAGAGAAGRLTIAWS
jgi:hypothetical protein